jgi:pseudouridine synthase
MKRLQKILADAGVASRRGAELLIKEGRVAVNGRPAALGESAADTDEVTLDGRPLATAGKNVYIVLHKPPGYVVTASDPQGRPTVMELVEEVGVRLFPVGRLDFDTSGLLLMTNDGGWANKIAHPRHGVEKVYRAKVQGVPRAAAIKNLREGVLLDEGKKTAPAKVKLLDDGRLELTIHEGRNRQVRRMCLAVGHAVTQLARVAVGNVKLGKLKPGQWRHLTPAELTGFTASLR